MINPEKEVGPVAANILLAEDDRALSALILDFFHAAGLEVLSVSDGE